MFAFQYFVLGFVQGLTEFLPISSSGHLILIFELTKWEDQGLFTDIAVHGGTLIAVLIYLKKEIIRIFKNFFQFQSFNSIIFFKIVLATLPAVIVGFFIYHFIENYFRNLQVVGWASIVFGVLLFFADKKQINQRSWEQFGFKQAFVVGLFQILAFIPGASRAGVTITGARILGFDRKNAAIFSMILSIPIILASIVLSLFNVINDTNSIINIQQSFFAAITAFLTALLSIHFMMTLIKKTNFNLFILYRICLGFVLLVFYA